MQIDIIKKAKTLKTPGIFIENETDTTFDATFKNDGTINCDELIECYTFESALTYTAEECLLKSQGTSNVTWNDSDIVNGEAEKDKKWIDGSIICLVIPCDDGNFYISYQTVVDRTNLRPLGLYNIQNNKGPFMALGKNKKIYFNEFVEY